MALKPPLSSRIGLPPMRSERAFDLVDERRVMTELEVTRRFAQRCGEAAAAEDWVLANRERDCFRQWCFLVAPGRVGHDLRFQLEREFEKTFKQYLPS